MPKKKGKKGPGPAIVGQETNEGEPSSEGREDVQAVTETVEETPSEVAMEGQDAGSRNEKKTNKKKSKKKDDWEDFDMEEALMEVSLSADKTESKDKVDETDKTNGKDKVDETDGKDKTEKADKTDGKEVLNKEVKKGGGPKLGKKGRKAKKDDWEDVDMETALAQVEEVVQEPSTSKKRAAGEGDKTRPEKTAQESVGDPVVASTVPEPVVASTVPEGVDGGTGAVAVADDMDEEDDKKKKNKKKKSAAAEKEDKKGKKSTVGTAIKKRLEAVRAAQKQREEEERKKIEAAEEAEHKRLEEIRLEEEKKMNKKMKEKEKIERLKREGKYLTKSEKEKKARQLANLEAIKAQGIDVPGLRQENKEGERKPVRYGNKVRSKKKGQPPSTEVTSSPIDESTPVALEECDSTGAEQGPDLSSRVADDWEAEEGVLESWDRGEEDSPAQNEGRGGGRGGQPGTTSPRPAAPEEGGVKPFKSSLLVKPGPPLGKAGTGGEGAKQTKAVPSSEDSDDEEEEEEEVLRSPVVCVLGHVDTGKTKILDKIRKTNVQDGEAGGITQQIGATFVPEYTIKEQTKHLKDFSRQELRLPGLLIIDTPGHESFSNLRTRGSSLCDVAILVVDVMHGLEPQTIESINILKRGRVPFIVALNKVDRLLDWKRSPLTGIRDNLKKQKPVAASQFEELYQQTLVQFAEQELNISLFWNKVDFKEYVPVCPTSAISGDGMGDLMALLTTVCQRQLLAQLRFSDQLECHVLEVKAISGLGMTVDVILRNGYLKEGDTIVLCGTDGPFTTQIRALLTPQPLRELRVKNAYMQHKTLAGAQGVKLTGKDMEKALAGTPLYVASTPDEVEALKAKLAATLAATLNAVKCQDVGVYVQASTLGSLEALVEFLKQSKIPYSGVNIGPVHKKDVMKASVMLEHKSDYAAILAFDVKVERDAQDMADNLGVRVFSADIIYHLFDSFMKHREELKQKLREQYKDIAIFPCKFKILPNCTFKTRDPIVVGVKVEGGLIKVGTPLTVPSKNFCDIGVVTSMEVNHKPVELVKKGTEVCLKIEPLPGEAPRLLGRHFDEQDLIVSKISRQSIDAVKEYFRDDLQKGDWQLLVELKKQFHIL